MPLPSLDDTISDATTVGTDLGAITTAIAALPATPHEADLPAIVTIVADLNTAALAFQSIVTQILTSLSTTRINQ